jgi:sterol desaturase/sphingolipid hydroxylase (fatty acid hydroxylase superfamily)
VSNAQSTAKQVENSEWMERAIRIGLVSYGVVHLLIAWLALQLAFGNSSGAANQQGAMRQLAQQPFGKPLLWVLALGFVALALWQGFDAVWGHRKHDGAKRTFKRVGSAGKVVVYLVLAFTAVKTAVGSSSSSSSKDGLTAKVMSWPFGQVLVAIVGLAIVGVGGYLVSRAVRKSFEHDLQPQATSGATGSTVVRLGQIGYTAKGVALGIVGVLFIWAALSYDPKKAGGLDAALHTLISQPFGPWLLALVAGGIGCFGVFCFFWAKDADTSS